MILSDISVDRPVFATVISLLLLAFGVMSFMELPLRQYPDISPPIVSVSTTYRGASATIVESKITRLIEDRISGIEGIKTLSSTSQDGRSNITIEFKITRDIDDAANDVRQRVSRLILNSMVILEGLEVGQRIIIEGTMKLRNGSKITIKKGKQGIRR